MRRPRPLDVAIVGMGCRFPGAPDLVAFWENILAGRDCIAEVPPDRWPASEFLDPSCRGNDRVTSTKGGYLTDPIDVDPAIVGAMPGAIDGGEPEQYLILDAARSALADAGWPDGLTDGRRVEVVVGRGNYFNRGNLTRLQHGRIVAQTIAVARALRPDLSAADLDGLRADLKAGLPAFGAETIPGQLTNATSGRVANRLDLRGANFVVDAASASSLVALAAGAHALTDGRADVAIVGGVYIQSDVDFPLVFSRLDALSRSGRSRPFASEADGMVPGEGVGVVVLKRLADAERDGDRVYATVKAVGLASDGRGKGLASPSARGHASAMRRAYRRSGIDPASVGLIEGHGLGLPAADRAELRAIRAVFPPSRDRVLGAVSSLIGHAMPASGIAGLIKATLALHHRALPTSPGADSPHPLLSGSDSPCRLLARTRPWIHGEELRPRRAAVNAFGFAGINAHAVLEEHAPSADGFGCLRARESEAILLASDDRASLVMRAKAIAEALERRPDLSLCDVAHTLGNPAPSGAFRLGLVVGSVVELARRLREVVPKIADPACSSVRDQRGTYFRSSTEPPPPLAVIFPGEGSQFPGMLADLCLHFPRVRRRLDIADRVALAQGATETPGRLLYGDDDEHAGLWSIGPAVNAVLASQWALFGLISELGVRPDSVVGHSSGEWLALAASGACRVDREFEDAMGRLGSAFATLESSGALPEARLLAVAASRERVESLLVDRPVVVAMDNCPHQVVLAGPAAEVEAFEGALAAEGILFEPLPFGRAYHTRAFASVVGPIREILDAQVIGPPKLPLYSCASADRMPTDRGSVIDLATEQWSCPVRFRETIERMYADGHRVFVDVGARGHLAGFVDDILRGKDAVAVATSVPRRSGVTQLHHLVATLFSLGYPLSTSTLFARRRTSPIDLFTPPQTNPSLPKLRLGFPEMRVSDAMAERLSRRDFLLPNRAEERRRDLPASFDPDVPAVGPIDDEAMLGYFRTMDHFLATQREVMSAYLDAGNATAPVVGPWVGEIQRIDGGRELVALYTLDAADDPVARQHTLGGRRVSRIEPDRLGLPVVPFAVMAEMLAQAAAVLMPGAEVVALRDVMAHRWIRYEDEPIALELLATREGDDRVRASIFNRGPASEMRPRETPVVEGTIVFHDRPHEPIAAAPFSLRGSRTSRFTAEMIYAEQWLFHGPALQAVSRVGEVSEAGIEGSLRVLPRGPLLRDPASAGGMRIDPIILDNFTHLLGCWGLDELSDRGDVVFPLRMGGLALFGEAPQDGSDVECRVRVTRLERHRVGAEAEIVRPDGTVWMRVTDWEDWRFHWPGRYRDVLRRPDAELLGEPLELPGVDPMHAVAIWLRPPSDFARPVWRDVLEQTQLSQAERAEMARRPDRGRTPYLFGRVAAKDAARRLALARGVRPVYPADLTIANGEAGAPLLVTTGDEDRWLNDPRLVSIAHADDVAVALATDDPRMTPGVDVEAVVPRTATFEDLAFTTAERRLIDLAARGADRDGWIARFWCAKEAAGKAARLGLIDGPKGLEVVGLGPGDGALIVSFGRAYDRSPSFAQGPPGPIRVVTQRRDDHAWAWSVGERSEHA